MAENASGTPRIHIVVRPTRRSRPVPRPGRLRSRWPGRILAGKPVRRAQGKPLDALRASRRSRTGCVTAGLPTAARPPRFALQFEYSIFILQEPDRRGDQVRPDFLGGFSRGVEVLAGTARQRGCPGGAGIRRRRFLRSRRPGRQVVAKLGINRDSTSGIGAWYSGVCGVRGRYGWRRPLRPLFWRIAHVSGGAWQDS